MALLPRSHPPFQTTRRPIRAGLSTLVFATWAFPYESVSAHTTDAIAPSHLLKAWQPDPLILIAVLLTAWIYARGVGRLNEVGERVGRGRIVETTRIAAFAAGLLTLLVALASPLDAATATIFSAHMVQHILLVAVAPPLLLLGQPLMVIMNGLPQRWRRPIATLPQRVPTLTALLTVVTLPIVAWLLHTATLWFWHIPVLYDAAVQNERIHVVEHATFVLTALLYWWTVIPAASHARNAVGPAMGILSVFAMGMQGATLGIMLTFWSTPLYPVYVGRSALWHLSTLSDQRLAGLIMWIPAGSIYVIAALALLRTWFREDHDAGIAHSSMHANATEPHPAPSG